MSRKIVVTDLASLENLPNQLHDINRPSWSYLGSNSTVLYSLKPILNRMGDFVCLGQSFNDTAARIREEFLNFDSILDLKAEDKLSWSLTHLAEKSPISSPLFGNVCAVLTSLEFISGAQRDQVLVVDDWFVAFFVATVAEQELGLQVTLNCENGENLKGSSFRTLRAIRRHQKEQARELNKRQQDNLVIRKQWVADLRSESEIDTASYPAAIDTLFVVWTNSATFPSQIDAGKEAYFGDLPLELGGRSEIAYLVNPIDWVEPLGDIYGTVINSKHAKQCLFLEDCIEQESFLEEAEKSIDYHLKRKGHWTLGGIKLSSLISDAFYREKAESPQARSLQFYFVARFLALRGTRVKRVVFPYENQPWEKALRLGFERWMPQTRVVGYFHTAASEFWLSSYPGETNLRENNIPHEIAVPGQYWHDRLEQNGFPASKLRIWPAFRFSYLHHDPESATGGPGVASETITTLLALPINKEAATELLIKSLRVFGSNEHFELSVRFHPKAGFNSGLMMELLPLSGMTELPENISVSSGPLSEDLERAQLVIANGTSIELQAMRKGIATLCLLSEHSLDMQMLPLDDYTFCARTVKGLTDVLEGIVKSRSHKDVAPWSDATLNHYFVGNTVANRERAFS